jgi:beta-glucosidase
MGIRPDRYACLPASTAFFIYLKTTACAKHFICNNTDDDRYSVSASVNSRNFWEYYTRAFRAAVIDGDVFGVMAAYNAINGVPCPADRFLLTSLLRRRWGFRGYVVSDCDAVACIYSTHHYVPTPWQAAGLAMQAGCDLNCGNTLTKYLGRAVDLELVSEADISLAVTRLLTTRFLLGEFAPPEQVPYNRIGFDVVNSPAHQKLALEAARQSIVLLKNNNNFLPQPKSDLKTVAVIGPMAGFHLGGYSGSPSIRISPLDGKIGFSIGWYRGRTGSNNIS